MAFASVVTTVPRRFSSLSHPQFVTTLCAAVGLVQTISPSIWVNVIAWNFPATGTLNLPNSQWLLPKQTSPTSYHLPKICIFELKESFKDRFHVTSIFSLIAC